LLVGGIRDSVLSSAAGHSVAKDSVVQMSYIAIHAPTPENEDSNVLSAEDDLLAPTISKNTLALTWWRHLANATIQNQHNSSRLSSSTSRS